MSHANKSVSQLQGLVLGWNKSAMDQLRANHPRAAIRLLRQAQKAIEEGSDPTGKLKLLAITLNNLGCYYKRTDKPLFALKYLHQALELESQPPVDHTNLAGTLLNICAIRSQLGKHETALAEAQKALDVLSQVEELTPNSVTTQSIAYHNAGMELEHLGRIAEALDMFHVGWEFAKCELGDTHPLAESLCKSYYRLVESRAVAHTHKRVPSDSEGGESLDDTLGFDFLHKALRLMPKATKTSGGARTSRHSMPPSRRGRKALKSRTLEQPMASAFQSPEKSKGSLERSIIGGDVRFITGERKRPMFKISFKTSHKPSSPISKQRNLHPAPPPMSIRKVFHKVENQRLSSPETERLASKVSKLDQQLGTLMKRVNDMEGERKTKSVTPSRETRRKGRTKREDLAAIVIQKWIRMFLARRKYLRRKKLQPLPKVRPKVSPPKAAAPPLPKPTPKKDLKTTLFDTPPKPEQASKAAPKAGKGNSKGRNVAIQGVLRGYLARKRHSVLKSAAITIQKHVRRYQCRALYKNIRAAIVCIQAWWRTILRAKKRRQKPKARRVHKR